jgi:processive 1,2-diacylglycerol beta-glucosyltransferase
MDRLLILHCPAGGGHRAAAEAIAEAAGGCAEVVDALALTPRWFRRGYVEAHLRTTAVAPWLYGMGYQRMNRRHPTMDRVRRRLDRAFGERLLRFVLARRPSAVIATHFFPLSVLGAARLVGALPCPLAGVVTDFAAHAFWAEPGVDLYCAPRGGAALDLARHGVPPAIVAETGIPVRGAFGRLPPVDPRGDRLRVLCTSGGFGIGPLATAIASFAGIEGVELTVVCGNNPRLERRAARAAERAGVRARVLGFERDMPARLAEADVVLGKPGGLTVSEALAAGRPLALVGACPGQEQHNEEWLTLCGAAAGVEPAHAGAAIAELWRNGALVAMAAAARRLGTPHAARDVLSTLRSLERSAAA